MTPEEFLCRVPPEVYDAYSEWQECVAFRFVKVDEDTVEVQVTRDLELLTRPGGEKS